MLDWLNQSGREPGGMFQLLQVERAGIPPLAADPSASAQCATRTSRSSLGKRGVVGRESPRRSSIRVPFSGDSGGCLLSHRSKKLRPISRKTPMISYGQRD
jgi:hypothetical protein